MTDHHYRLAVEWTGDRGTGTSGYRDYDRAITVRAEGKPDLFASADRTFHGDASRWNPEEMLVAALSSCHMLTLLAVAARKGLTVDTYEDDAIGTLGKNDEGRMAVTHVTLRPRIVFAGDAPDAATLQKLHESAHRNCFIASSVKTVIAVDPR